MNLFRYIDDDLKIHHSVDPIPAPEKYQLHAHRTCELYYFISGDGYYTVEGNDYELVPGCLLVMRGGETHTPHIRPDSPYERISVNFAPDVFPLLQNEIENVFEARPLGKNNMYVPPRESAKFVADCMARICRDALDKNARAQALTNLMPVLLELYHLKNDAPVAEENLRLETQGSSDLVAQIIGYINDHLTTITGLDVLEQEFFFSRSYINRIFKESTGSSVWDYIVLKRLLLSRTLLQEGKQATIVASQCGFCDYSSFYRQFKQRFGVSPIEAKKKGKN